MYAIGNRRPHMHLPPHVRRFPPALIRCKPLSRSKGCFLLFPLHASPYSLICSKHRAPMRTPPEASAASSCTTASPSSWTHPRVEPSTARNPRAELGTILSFAARPPLRQPTAFDPKPVLCHLPELALNTKYFVDHLGSFPDLSSGLVPLSAFGRTAPPQKDPVQ
jgi:hypothetical protein